MGVRRATVAVLGLGPAGRALTSRLAARGVDVVGVDPSPDRRWTPTYAAWVDELPSWLPAEVVATRFRPRAWARREREVPRDYAVLSTGGLQDALDLSGATVLPQLVRRVSARTVWLSDGTQLVAEHVVDARGAGLHPDRAQQTAVGVVVPRQRAEELLGGAWLMDWRRDADTPPGAPPSFLYAVPLDEQDTLLEETCLVGRPALGMRELRRRLESRLAGHGLTLSGYERTEHVRFSVEADPADDVRGGPVLFGARGGLMHPATGYSVAVSLREVDRLVDAVVTGRDLRRALWPPAARLTQSLRQAGLRTLLALPPEGTLAFFDAFFDLPLELQRGYLSHRAAPRATMAAMLVMARNLPPRLTATAVRSTASELAPSPRRTGR